MKTELNILGIEVGDVVTWGDGAYKAIVIKVDSEYFYHDDKTEFKNRINEVGLKIVKKREQSIEEKYGIELINKEMWCWHNDSKRAGLYFVLCKNSNPSYLDSLGNEWNHASLENPNKEIEYDVKELFNLWDKLTKKELLTIVNNLPE